jgi:hypothetical protein
MTFSTLPRARRDLYGSLLLLGAVVALSLAGLAADGNWPKVLRVATAAVGYAAVLLAAGRRSTTILPWRVFAAAGAVAGLLSGAVRAETGVPLLLAQTAAGALLLGGFHRLALGSWRSLLPPSRPPGPG